MAATVVALAVLAAPRPDLDKPLDGRTPAAATDAATRDRVLLDRLSVSTGRTIRSADVIVAGAVGDETVVMVTREATASDAAAGGKAVAVWSVTPAGRVFPVVDYLGYDSACLTDDGVCTGVRRSGVGLAAVVVRQGTAYVFVAGTADHPVTVRTAEGGTRSFTPGRAGGVLAVRTTQPWDVLVRPQLDDGRSYTIPLGPGAVVEM